MIAIGPIHFRKMLEELHVMDEHCRSAPIGQSLPALRGLLAIWNNDVIGAPTLAVLPYCRTINT